LFGLDLNLHSTIRNRRTPAFIITPVRPEIALGRPEDVCGGICALQASGKTMTNDIDCMYDCLSHNVLKGGVNMFARFHRGIVVAVAALMLGACAGTGVPVQNVIESPVVSNKPNPSMDDVRQAILRAGAGLGWQMRAERPGHIVGTLALRTHLAVVDIDYNPKAYSIKYKDSTNLEYNGSTIHRNYNAWIERLDRAVKTQLTVL
jgi:hypothetical protein